MMTEDKNKDTKEDVKLTKRQEAFIRYYKVCRNGSEACRQAGYSHHSADVIASRLLGDARIAKRIEEESEYDFEQWCSRVKRGILNHGETWQAEIKYLELYGKARGWLRENITNNNFLTLNQQDLDRIRNSVRENLMSDNSNHVIDVTNKPQALENKELTS